VFLACLTIQATLRVGQYLQAGTVDPGTAGLAEAVGSVVEFNQCSLHFLQRGFDFAVECHSHSLLKGVGRIISDMIAVADALVLRGLEPFQLLLQFRLLLL
jgi:hypothetical protein